MVVAWSRKYCLGLAEIACFVSGFIQGWGTQSESNISFLFLMFIKGMRRWGGSKISLHDTRDGKILLRSSTNC